LKILVISQYWAPENGVPQRRWTWLTSILEADGHSVTVIAPPPHYDRNPSLSEWWRSGGFRTRIEQHEGGRTETIVRTGFFPAGRSLTQRILNQAVVAIAALWVILKRPGVLKDYKPELIIGSVPALPTAVVTYLASKRFHAPYVIDLRDAWPELINERDSWNSGLGKPSLRETLLSKGPVQFLGLVAKYAINFSLQRASALIVTSTRLGNSLRQKFTESDSSNIKPIAVVRNVFPVESRYERRLKATESLRQLNVLYAGTLGRAQNLSNAVYAVAIAQENGYEVNLRFVGAGAARQELVRIAKALAVNVEFSSRAAAEELSEHYSWADSALVHLTDWDALKRAVPSKTYELMSCGVHISAVADGETKELVEKLGAGHVVSPERPHELALLWKKLIDEPQNLEVSSGGAHWVEEQRTTVAPKELLRVVKCFQ